MGLHSAATAATVQIDFGDFYGTESGWNLIDVTDVTTPLTLFDENGVDTSVTLSNVTTGDDTVNGNFPAGQSITNGVLPSAVGDDSLILVQQGANVVLSLSGLDDTTAYTVEIYSFYGRSVGTPSNLDARLVTGDGVFRGTADHSDAQPLVFENVTFTGGFAEFAFVGQGSGAVLNAIRITDIPEPASLALMGLGGLTMLSRRRKAFA